MKTYTLYASCIVLLLLISSCRKKPNVEEVKNDTSPPTITINGSNELVIPFGVVSPDPGATAIDAEDGDISANIVSTWSKIDIGKISVNLVEYSVSDKSGNKASGSRIVTVKYLPLSLAGEYKSVITFSTTTLDPFTSKISVGSQINEINIAPFYSTLPSLNVDLSRTIGDAFSFSQASETEMAYGVGEIKELGKKIVLTYTISTNNVERPIVEVLTRK